MRRVTGLLLIAFTVLVGCRPSPRAPKTLSVAVGSDITSLDPVRITEDAPRLIAMQVLETPVGFDERLHLRPLLAEGWESLNGGREWRFRIRRGVYFHEDPCLKGSRTVTARDVAYSITRMLDPATGTLGAFILTDILEGAREFLERKSDRVSGIIVEDEQTLRFRLVRPYAYFPQRLTLPFAAVVPRECVEYYGNGFGTHPVGTGPYRFVSWDMTTGTVELERNPRYWREIPTNVRRLRFRILKTEAARLAALDRGEADVLEVSPELYEKLRHRADVRFVRQPILKVYFVGFNFENPLLRDRNLRVAMNLAVDRAGLVRDVLGGLAVEATGPVPPPLPGAFGEPPYGYDPARARRLVRESGYDGTELVYMTDNSPTSMAVAEYLQDRLGAVGIRLRVDANPESVWIDKLVRGAFDLAFLYFALDYPSPDNVLSQFYSANFSPAGPNFFHYRNSEFDRLYERALGTTDEARAAELFRAMGRIIREDAPWIFLYYPERLLAVRRGVEGVKVNSLSFSLILEDVRVP